MSVIMDTAGTAVNSTELVAKLRKFRGRLTRWEMCRELGYDNWTAFRAVSYLCKRHGITTLLSSERAAQVHTDAAGWDTAKALAYAKRVLADEVKAAREQMAMRPVHPFKPPLNWGGP